MTYYLKDKSNNKIISRFDIKDATNTYLEGKCYNYWAWKENDYPCEYKFFAEIGIKWDACSHWYFYGEDYEVESNPENYYHICGSYSFTEFITNMCFIWEVARRHFNKKDSKDFFIENNTKIRTLLENFNKDYEIVTCF